MLDPCRARDLRRIKLCRARRTWKKEARAHRAAAITSSARYLWLIMSGTGSPRGSATKMTVARLPDKRGDGVPTTICEMLLSTASQEFSGAARLLRFDRSMPAATTNGVSERTPSNLGRAICRSARDCLAPRRTAV